MLTDETGSFPFIIAIILGVTTVIGMVSGGIVAYNQGKRGWEVFGAVMLGGAIGFAAGGLIVATSGAFYGAVKGITATLWGVTAQKVFAIGALAYNSFAMVVAPILGLTLEAIGTVDDKDKTKVEKPGETRPFPPKRRSALPNTFMEAVEIIRSL
jgi:hypothetical protein